MSNTNNNADLIASISTLAIAQQWKADSEKTCFLCDLTGLSVTRSNFDAVQDKIEGIWEALLAEAAAHDFKAGDFVQYTMVTDSVVLEVVRTTAKSIWVRRCQDGELLKSENRDGNPYPVAFTEQLPDEEAGTRRLGLNKKGFFKICKSFGRIYPANTFEGKPVRKVDYRM
jgi:hypothetical protein